MEIENMKKGMCTLKLEGLKKVYNQEGQVDDTLVRATFSILDFMTSGNKQLVSKEIAVASAPSLKFKPLLCQYIETTDFEQPNDDFGTHGEIEGNLRTGDECILTTTHAIGVCEKDAYIGVTKDEEGNDLDVLMADFLLWKYRYPNEISLINEFHEKGENLYSSCEYYYTSSNMQVDSNGKMYEQITSNLIFDGHCILGRNIEPAYKSSKLISFNAKWNKAINQLAKEINNKSENSVNEPDLIINNNNNMGTENEEEEIMTENKFYKALCELSLGDIKSKIMEELSKTMTAKEFQYIWLSNFCIYDNYFVYENYEDSKYVYYKVPYTKTESDVVVDLAQKVQVTREDVWVEVGQIVEVQTSLNTANERVAELETALNTKVEEITTKVAEIEAKEVSLNELTTKVEALTTEKEQVLTQFNEATEKVTSLNSLVEELKPIKEKYETEQMEKALNEKKEFYKEKFKGVNALDKFEEESVQNLIAETIVSETEIANKAIFSLNSMIIDLVTPVEVEPVAGVKEFTSSMNGLIPESDDFEKKYGI